MSTGGDEILVDSIREFGVKFTEGWVKRGGEEERVRVEVGEKDAHVGPIVDFIMRYKEKGTAQIGFEKWFEERLVGGFEPLDESHITDNSEIESEWCLQVRNTR